MYFFKANFEISFKYTCVYAQISGDCRKLWVPSSETLSTFFDTGSHNGLEFTN